MRRYIVGQDHDRNFARAEWQSAKPNGAAIMARRVQAIRQRNIDTTSRGAAALRSLTRRRRA